MSSTVYIFTDAPRPSFILNRFNILTTSCSGSKLVVLLTGVIKYLFEIIFNILIIG